MKRLLFTVGLFATLACPGLYAQAPPELAYVPFDFQIGGALMPAGEYIVHCPSGGFGVLTIGDTSGKHTVAVLATAAVRPRSKMTGALQFHKYGDAYFFAQVWTPTSTVACLVSESRREQELARGTNAPQAAAVTIAKR